MKPLIACCLLAAAAAHASVVRFTFTGTIDQITGPPTIPVLIGDPFSVSYTFDAATPDLEPDPNIGWYLGALIEVQGQIGPVPLNYTLGSIEVRNDTALGDIYTALSGAATSDISFYLADWESGAFQNDDLPTTLQIGRFDPKRFGLIKYLSATSQSTVSGTITGFSSAPVCYPDCNDDGSLTVADFGCFQSAFVAGDPYADCNQSGSLTIADFGCFQTQFVQACP